MSLDRMQSRQGTLVLNPEPSYTVASSLSSIASNQLAGGLQIGQAFAIAAATQSYGGGAQIAYVHPSSATSAVQNIAGTSSAMLSHDNAAVVLASVSAAGLHQLQPAQYRGQLMTVLNLANASCSFASLFNTASGNGTLSTTTATVYGAVATTIAASGYRQFVAVENLGGSVGTNTRYVWMAIG